MKVQVAWDNDEQTIIRYTFEANWDWKDLYTAMDEASHIIQGVSHRVDVLMDLSQANLIPKNAISQIKRGYDNPKSPNIGLTVIVTPNSFMNAMVSMAKKIWGGGKDEWELEFVKTNEEAYTTIAAHSIKKKSVNGQ
jgi:hypothetical protein